MLTIFNRRRLIGTFSMKEQAKLRKALANARIPYDVVVVSAWGGSATGWRTARFGENINAAYEYIFYVRKKDLNDAQALLGLRL